MSEYPPIPPLDNARPQAYKCQVFITKGGDYAQVVEAPSVKGKRMFTLDRVESIEEATRFPVGTKVEALKSLSMANPIYQEAMKQVMIWPVVVECRMIITELEEFV